MTDPKRWPSSLKDATPYNFKVTKQDILDQNDLKSPELYVNIIIKEWMESITPELIRANKPMLWEHYPSFFGKALVQENEIFPRTIPIGYVLVCFLQSVYPKTATIKDVTHIFNYWIQTGDNRTNLFAAFTSGKLYRSEDEINYNNPPKVIEPAEPDGKAKADMLYGGRQQSMFNG